MFSIKFNNKPLANIPTPSLKKVVGTVLTTAKNTVTKDEHHTTINIPDPGISKALNAAKSYLTEAEELASKTDDERILEGISYDDDEAIN